MMRITTTRGMIFNDRKIVMTCNEIMVKMNPRENNTQANNNEKKSLLAVSVDKFLKNRNKK